MDGDGDEVYVSVYGYFNDGSWYGCMASLLSGMDGWSLSIIVGLGSCW